MPRKKRIYLPKKNKKIYFPSLMVTTLPRKIGRHLSPLNYKSFDFFFFSIYFSHDEEEMNKPKFVNSSRQRL